MILNRTYISDVVVIVSQYKVIDHKSILSIYIIYEYAIGICGGCILLINVKPHAITLYLCISHYLFQMEHETAKILLT